MLGRCPLCCVKDGNEGRPPDKLLGAALIKGGSEGRLLGVPKGPEGGWADAELDGGLPGG